MGILGRPAEVDGHCEAAARRLAQRSATTASRGEPVHDSQAET